MNEIKPYEQALWEWFLINAQLRTVYGFSPEVDALFRQHMEQCGIDHDDSDTPSVGTFSEFVSTFDGNSESVGVVAERWRCKCGKYSDRDLSATLVIPGEIVLGRVIYEVIQLGLGNHLLEQITAPEEN